MASVGAEEVEYESDPEEAKLSLKLRRREASDDEEEEGGGGDHERDMRDKPQRQVDSDGESDGQGAAAEYDDDDEELEEYEEYEEVEEEYVERGVEIGGGEIENMPVGTAVEAEAAVAVAGEAVGANESLEVEGENQVEEEEKKEGEPFAVPTAGAFYMHDDRFRDNAGARNRRTLGGKKLWELKDERKWGHDKFEEITFQERHYDEGRRNSRGHYRARGKNQGADRGYQRGNRSKAYNNDNQNQAPKTVRGRGPRRYEPSFRNSSEAPRTQNRQSGKSVEKSSNPNSGRSPGPTSNIESAGKHVFASSLSSASPPFYPSGSSNKEITVTQKRNEKFSASKSNSMIRGKDVADLEKLYIDESNESVSSVSTKLSTNYRLPSSQSSMMNVSQSSSVSSQMNFQPRAPHSRVNRVSPPNQMNIVQRSPVQTRISTGQASARQSGQRPGSGSQASSPPKSALVINSFEPAELESLVEASKSKGAVVGKVKDSVQGSGRGSFLYNAAQIMGASGNLSGGHGDQNFAPTPAFLPVMQFGNQHPGGMGVPAVGMAFPGYVANPQGMGSSEMTWLPVLAGAAGALGGTYPYITVDGAYHAHPPALVTSSGSSSKETNATKPTDEWQPPQKPELASDEFGQRQNNARRYSKMNFSQ